MSMRCPQCQSDNEEAAEVCFHCRAVLAAVTRGTLVGGRYRIVASLGRGGMGAVYRARDEVLEEEVALKILRPEVAGTPEMAARFRSEIKLARKVSHWNVCRIHEYGEDGTLQYISMELIPGATLKDRLRGGPLAPDQAFDVAAQVADGLAAIHKVGIVHRDLKSANVMIDEAGTAKVMDFGIAKPAMTGTDAGPSTGYVLGSPEYMSPEQARGRRADFRSDLYSLGVVVFEAFTGRVPFRGSTPVQTLMMHVESPPPIDDPALALPASLRPVLRSALAKDPSHRFADAPAMAAALRAARGQPGAAAPAVDSGSTQRLRDPVPRPRARVLGLAAIAALAAVAALLWRGTGQAPDAVLIDPRPTLASPLPPPAAMPGPQLESPLPSVPDPSTTEAAPAPIAPSRAAAPAPGPETAPAPVSVPPVAASGPAATATASAAAPPATRDAVPEPSPTATAAPAAAPAAEGWLLVLAVPWAEVTVDGRPVGMTPLQRLPLPAGPHAIMLTHPQYQPFTRRVTIQPGETTRVRIDFAEDGVRRR